MEQLIIVFSVAALLTTGTLLIRWMLKTDSIVEVEKSKFERALNLIRAGEILVRLEEVGIGKNIRLVSKDGVHICGWLSEGGWPHHLQEDCTWSAGAEFLGLRVVTGRHLAKIYAASKPSVEDLENSNRERVKQDIKSELDEQLADFDRRLKEISK